MVAEARVLSLISSLSALNSTHCRSIQYAESIDMHSTRGVVCTALLLFQYVEETNYYKKGGLIFFVIAKTQ